MRSISVQDLHDRTPELLEEVQAQEVSYVIHSGEEPIAFLSPLKPRHPEDPADRKDTEPTEGWESYVRLSESLRARWPAGTSTSSLLDEIRRPA